MKLFGSLTELVKVVMRKSGYAVTVEPSTASADTSFQLPAAGGGTKTLVTTDANQTLTTKTIDGDDNTIQDVGLGSLKTVLADANKVIRRNASGAVVSDNTLPNSSAIVTIDASQSLTNKTIDGDDNTVQDLALTSIKTVLADANKVVRRDTNGIVVSDNSLPNSSAIVTVDATQSLTNKSLSDSTTAVVDVTDSTKQIKFDAGGTASTSTTIAAAQTANRTLTLPDVTGTILADTNAVPVVIDVSSASDALRVTQRGAGNALVVEDQANPDASAFVVDASGNLFVAGGSAYVGSSSSITPNSEKLQVSGNYSNLTTGAGAQHNFYRINAGSTAVATGNLLINLQAYGYDGANYQTAAFIRAQVDNTGTISATSMPGRIVLSTASDGSVSPLERIRIEGPGRTIINANTQSGGALSTTTGAAKLHVGAGTYTDAVTAASGTVTHGAITSFDNPAIAASNSTVTYTNASTVYIDGAPTNGTNVTITNAYALYVAAGTSYLAGNLGVNKAVPDSQLHIGQTNGSANSGAVTLDEKDTTPTAPSDGTQCRIYMKADKLVIQYQDGATLRYKYLDLTGTGVTWTHTTTAP